MFFDYDDIFDGFYMDGHHPRAFGASVSKRAMDACESAKKIFTDFLANVDVSRGDVTVEIIRFHLVPDMKKAFSKFVREHGCRPTYRKLTREEQDRFNANRKSLMTFTSVTVSAAAQAEYVRKHPKEAEASRSSRAAGAKPSTSTTSSATSASSSSSISRPVALRNPLAAKKRNVKDAGLAEASGAKKARIV